MNETPEEEFESKLRDMALRLEALDGDESSSADLLDQIADDLTPDQLAELQRAHDALAMLRQMRELNASHEPTQYHESNPASVSRRIGPYKLLQQIGEGGMGAVWMAEQQEPVRRQVAIKLIKPGRNDKQVIARFEAERQALAMMDHPNIATVLDAGSTEDGVPYFVMELVKGSSITDFCNSKRLTPRERLRLFTQVCDAVQHAHLKGIIHRDLKPSNILVYELNGKPTAKVIDFGLAKALDHQALLTDKTMFTQFGQVVGTVQYMSPEQANLSSFDIDARTDVYSLGVILYELLTGSTPLDKDTLADHAIHQLLEFIRDKDPPRPSHRLSSSVESVEISEQRQVPQSRLQEILRSDLDWVVMKAIEKDRNRRYTTPSDLGNDLARFLEGESVVARPPTTGYLLQKYVRKHKVLVATAAAFLALLTSAIIGITNYAIKADRSRREMQVVARRTQGVLDIVTDSFGAIDPNAGSDASMSAKDVLLEARKILAESDLDDEGRMELLNRLGETLFALTEFEESVDVREQLLELCKKHYGDSHKETVDAMTELGSSYRGVGKIAEAIQLQEAALDIYRTEFGEKNPLLIGKLNSLGTSYHSNGQPAKAVTVFEEMVALSVETQGEDHFDTVSSRMQLATVYQEAGRVEEAVPMLVKAEEYFRTNFGKDNLKRLVVLNNLAYGKRMVGSPEEAVPLLEEATQIMRKKFGDEDANTLGTMKCLGFAYCESSQNDKAIPIFEETLELCRAKDGEKGSSTNALRRHLAHAYEVEGRVEDALLLVKEALNINKEAAGEDWSFFVLQSQYGGLQLKRGRIEESSKLLADSYDGMQRFADQVDPNVVKQQMPHAIRRLIKLAEAQEDLEKVSHWTKLLAEY